ncbi:MAG: glutamate synthase subunit alpha, partial [Lachnospiraceae bacterium]|nr:glutamate synthase subunit alpha [Lachnospiraceae bacterium]
YMAKLGVRTLNELVGRTDFLKMKEGLTGAGARMDLSGILARTPDVQCTFDPAHIYNFKLEETLDEKVVLKNPAIVKAVADGTLAVMDVQVGNTDRTFGTLLGAEITRAHHEGLPEDTITLNCTGAAGQSFGAFIPSGLTISLTGDANDYFGKGLSGGKMILKAPANAGYEAEDNIIVGNVALYGATSGSCYVAGKAGERFCVRNSGAVAVVEGVGEHGCEYMTGGRAVIIGPTGKNFAAGMSGGVAYVYDEHSNLYKNLNKELVLMEKVENKPDKIELKTLLENHVAYTGSAKAKKILSNFDEELLKFKKIIPADYKKLIAVTSMYEEQGMSREQAQIEAFYTCAGEEAE